MGFLDDVFDFFTGTSNTETDQTATVQQDQDVQRTQLSGQTQASTAERGQVSGTEQQTTSDQQQVTQLLDPETQELLRGLVQTLGTGVGGETGAADAISELQQVFAGQFADRAAGADDFSQNAITDVITAARASGEEEVALQNRRIAERSGSSFNTLVQDLSQRNTQDFETQLAGVAGQLALGGREGGTQEFLGASEGLRRATESARLGGATGVSDLATIVELLKGATQTSAVTGEVAQTGRTETQETTNQLSQVIAVLEELQSGRSIRTSDQSGDSSQSGTIFDLLNVI